MDSYIKPLLNRVIQSERLGVSSSVVEFTSVSSHFGEEPEDRFELKIPYAGHNLIWNILFDPQYPEVGPDFIFDEGTFLTDPDVDDLTNYVPSLRTWNPHDTNALLNVLKELLEYYKHHQIELCIKQGKRLETEYTRLISDTKICKEDVEMILLPQGNKPHEAKFLIRINVDSSRLPLRENLSQNDRAMLLITFRSPDWNYVTPQLYLSKSLEEVLGGPNDFHIPPFLSHKSMKDYVPVVQKLIAKKIDFLVRSHEKRKDFISTLLLLLRGSIAEYDAIEFSYITLLLEHQDFYFFIHIHLDKGFPQNRPSVVLRSVYSLPIPGKVYYENFRSFHWQSNWDAETMITDLISRIMHEVPKFQSNSMKQNQFG